MPQIQDYSAPQVEASQPVGGVSPNLEAITEQGRGLERIGEAVEQGADVVHRREAQKEISTTYAQIAQARADWTQKLLSQYNDPNFSTDQFQQQYSDYVDQIGNNLNTAEGKDFFTRQAARLGGNLLTLGSKLQAQRDGAQAKSDADTWVNKNSNTLAMDPSQFPDIVDGTKEVVDAMVKANPRLAATAPKLQEYMQKEMAKAAIRGWTNVDPGSANADRDGAGKQMMDSGVFDQYLDNDTKAQMYTYVKRQQISADTESARVDKAQERAQKAQYEAWGQQATLKLERDALSTHDLHVNGPDGKPILNTEQILKWENLIKEHANQDFKGNKILYANTIQKIQNGDIDSSDTDKVRSLVGRNGLSISQSNQIINWMNSSPEAKEAKAQENIFFKQLWGMQTINPQARGLVKERVADAFNDLQAKKKALISQGKPVTDLWDPNKPDYFGSPENVAKYRPSMQDEMSYMNQAMMKKAVTPAPGEKPNPDLHKQGESMTDFLKRTKSKGGG